MNGKKNQQEANSSAVLCSFLFSNLIHVVDCTIYSKAKRLVRLLRNEFTWKLHRFLLISKLYFNFVFHVDLRFISINLWWKKIIWNEAIFEKIICKHTYTHTSANFCLVAGCFFFSFAAGDWLLHKISNKMLWCI